MVEIREIKPSEYKFLCEMLYEAVYIPTGSESHSLFPKKQSKTYEKAGFEKDARSFCPAAEILTDLKVQSIVLLTNNAGKAEDLKRWEIKVNSTKAIDL